MTLDMPAIGYGTWMRRGLAGRQAVETAIACGYRHIDTAQGYENEGICGEAIAGSGLPRETFFVTTKVRPQHLVREMFLPTVEESLARLRTDYVDQLLIHWPSPNDEVPLASYIQDLVRARELGYARSIGLSNFTRALVLQAEDVAGAGAFATLQVEVHPFHLNRAMTRFCAARGIAVTAFSPLALGRVATDPVLLDIAGRHAATSAQVALAFLLARGFAAIPTSSRPEHIRANLGAADLVLTQADMARIDALDRNERLLDPDHAPPWDPAELT